MISTEKKNLALKVLVDEKQLFVSEFWSRELLVYVSFNEPLGIEVSLFLMKLELSESYLYEIYRSNQLKRTKRRKI